MMEDNREELVEELCPQDCVYRCRFDNTVHFCDYIGFMGVSRNCPVSQCDKYRRGKKRFTGWTNAHDWEVRDNYEIIYEDEQWDSE